MNEIGKYFRDVACGKIKEVVVDEEKKKILRRHDEWRRDYSSTYDQWLADAKEQNDLYIKYIKDTPRTVTTEQKELVKAFIGDIYKSTIIEGVAKHHIGYVEIYAIIDYINATSKKC